MSFWAKAKWSINEHIRNYSINNNSVLHISKIHSKIYVDNLWTSLPDYISNRFYYRIMGAGFFKLNNIFDSF